LFAYLRLGQGVSKKECCPDVERIIHRPFRFINKIFVQKARKENRSIFELYATSPMLNDLQKQRIEELAQQLRGIGKRTTANAIAFIRKTIGYDGYIRDHCDYRKLSPAGLFEIASELQEAAAAFPEPMAFIAHAEEAIEAAKQIDPHDTQPRVTRTTLHSAKGLEFDTVFIAGAVEGLIPHERSTSSAALEEERRLFYVGVTRAKQHLYISVMKKRHEEAVKPSRFIGGKTK
jgi:DNA helicase-2/ATP-dependent DNA helicase PcrA